MAGQFFDRFSQIIAGEAPPASQRRRHDPPWIWMAGVAGAAVLAVILYILLV